MQILIDTHILISREFDRTIQRHIQEVIRLINDLNYRLVVHPLSVTEVEKDKNIQSKNVILSKIRTYSSLDVQQNPYNDEAFFKLIGKPKNEREKNDSYLLYCLYKNEVDLFLTEDPDIIAKASLLNISHRTLNLKDALSYFKTSKQKKTQVGDKPEFCFFKKGPKWYIGEKGKESIFDDLKGFEFIHFLLKYEYENIQSTVIYHCGKSSGGKQEIFNLSKQSPIYNKRLSEEEREVVKSKIDDLQEQIDLHNYISIEDEENKMELISKLKKALQKKPIRDHKSEKERVRLNVTRSIRRALKEIHKDESISSITRYLNKSTIETGDDCIYKPVVNDKPSWILYHNDLI